MKKTLTGTLALLAGASVVYGQGNVSLGNYGGQVVSYLYVGFKATPTSTPVELGGASTTTPTLSNFAAETGNGTTWTVALYGAVGTGVPSAMLSPLSGETATFEVGTSVDHTPGTWISTAVYAFPGTSSPNFTGVTLQLYAWYNDGGAIANYSQAVADGVPVGSSSTANLTLTFPPTPPAALPDALGSFNVMATPEPSTIALGVIGASTFLMRLRRKQ
jgi:hypothetical protein